MSQVEAVRVPFRDGLISNGNLAYYFDYITRHKLGYYSTHNVVKEFPATSVPDISVVQADLIFKEDIAVMGFGRPNVFIARVNRDGTVSKLDVKSMWRANAKITTTDGRLQSGIYLVPVNAPPEMVEAISRSCLWYIENHPTTVSCAHGCATVLEHAGLKPNRDDRNLFYPSNFSSYYLPYSLLMELCMYGGIFNGKKVEFVMVNTTGDNIRSYYNSVWWATWTTLWRHQRRCTDTEEAKTIRRAEGQYISKINTNNIANSITSADLGHMNTVRTSRCSHLVKHLRKLVGDHTIWRMDLPGVTGIETLRAYAHKKNTMINTIKQNVLFCPPMVSLLGALVSPGYGSAFQVPSKLINTMLTPKHRLNYVWYGDKNASTLVVTLVNGTWFGALDWVLAKHVYLSRYSEHVFCAGEIWLEEERGIVINGDSGTYQPGDEHLMKCAALLSDFLGLDLVIEDRNGQSKCIMNEVD